MAQLRIAPPSERGGEVEVLLGMTLAEAQAMRLMYGSTVTAEWTDLGLADPYPVYSALTAIERPRGLIMSRPTPRRMRP